MNENIEKMVNAAVTSTQWACIACTLLLDFSIITCLACGTRQPRNRNRECTVFPQPTIKTLQTNVSRNSKKRGKKKKRGRPRAKKVHLLHLLILGITHLMICILAIAPGELSSKKATMFDSKKKEKEGKGSCEKSCGTNKKDARMWLTDVCACMYVLVRIAGEARAGFEVLGVKWRPEVQGVRCKVRAVFFLRCESRGARFGV